MITGIGMIAAVGRGREQVWEAVRHGRTQFGWLGPMRGIEAGEFMGAEVDMGDLNGRLKILPMCSFAAAEALRDANLDLDSVDRNRVACAVNAHMGDTTWIDEQAGKPAAGDAIWWQQWLPNSACCLLANEYGLGGPRLAHSTACASGLISVQQAVRNLRDGTCDLALAGGADAIDPLFAAGFRNMKVLASHESPQRACRPYDRNRNGFVMGEGGAFFVLERLSHAVRRDVRIYAEIAASHTLSAAQHVTAVDAESDALSYLINRTIKSAGLTTSDIGYINSHGTGTVQNDLAEMRAIREVFGCAGDVCVSANKSILGHLVNAAGCVELALTAMGLRDGFAPPTMNVSDPDPECSFDCLPQFGRSSKYQHALKISVAFGGHLVAMALTRWNDASTAYRYPDDQRRAA
ncbi:MAG: beta-ketoacyl-[acyl-carrier-protein] synthase family protein [Pirellulaceae bacterium]|nr:beta-ketoacyl-[acyl-carrier-protein] synthase family protein [Pirellulaceae bacterium]